MGLVVADGSLELRANQGETDLTWEGHHGLSCFPDVFIHPESDIST